jgi:hypothetical protein
MPNRQRRLNQGEEAEYRRCLQEMQAEGIDVGELDPAPEHPSALDIIAVGGLASFISTCLAALPATPYTFDWSPKNPG